MKLTCLFLCFNPSLTETSYDQDHNKSHQEEFSDEDELISSSKVLFHFKRQNSDPVNPVADTDTKNADLPQDDEPDFVRKANEAKNLAAAKLDEIFKELEEQITRALPVWLEEMSKTDSNVSTVTLKPCDTTKKKQKNKLPKGSGQNTYALFFGTPEQKSKLSSPAELIQFHQQADKFLLANPYDSMFIELFKVSCIPSLVLLGPSEKEFKTLEGNEVFKF